MNRRTGVHILVSLFCVLSLVVAAPHIGAPEGDEGIVADLGGETDPGLGTFEEGDGTDGEDDSGGADGTDGEDDPGGADDTEGDDGTEDGGPTDEFDSDFQDVSDTEAEPLDSEGIEETAESDEAYGAPTVGPVSEPYFRTASYATFTGNSWVRPSETSPYEGPRADPVSDATVRQYEVTVEAPVQTLPAPWEPDSVGGVDAPVRVADDGAFEFAETAQEGERFTVESRVPDWTHDELRTASTAYPDEIESRYTQMPSETPQRLEDHAADITSDADSPYETAVAIEEWLLTNKGYSLEIDQPEENFADSFVFEMEEGYCQYFATAMVAMLRAEDVPARYVTGYSPSGYNASADAHEIQGGFAHAWVEVYFPDVGWVKFDPTPPAREDVREELDATTTQASWNTADSTVSEAFSTAEDDDWEPIDTDIEAHSQPTPGEDLTVTVRYDGERLEDSQVRFNDDPVGITNASGMATGEVPYEDSLEITTFIQPEDHPDREEEEQEDEQDEQEDEQDEQEDEQDEQQEAAEDDDEEGAEDEDPAAVNGDLSAIADKRANSDESELGGSIGELSSTVLFTIEETTAPQQASQSAPDERYQLRDDATPASEGVQFDLPTDIDIEIEGEVAPGRTVDVVATIEGSPVADATVEAGNQSTTTDDEGIAAVEIPFVAELRVVVERGDASGERLLDIPADRTTVTVETEPIVPTNEMGISATVAGEPLADGSVSIGNETVAETDGDGVASFDAPPDDATAVVERGEVTARTDVEPVSELDVEVLTRPIPGTDQTVRVTVDDRPVRNATVDVLGHEVGTTDGNGTVVFGFTGVTASYTATATVGAAEGTSDPQSVWPYWLAVLAAIGLLVGAVVRRYGVRRHVGTARSRAVAARDAVKRAVAYTRRTVRRAAYAIVDGLTAGFLWLYGRVAALGAWLAKLAEDASGTLLRTAKRIANGLKRLSEAETWVGFGRWLAGLPRRLVAAVLAVFTGSPSDSRSAALSAAELANDVDAEDPSVSDLVRIYQAWLRLASEVGYRRSMTPTEVADEAERRGFQSAPVQELTTVFQEIRYADRPVTSDRIETAVDALDRIAGDSE